jgi:hypothetical protein
LATPIRRDEQDNGQDVCDAAIHGPANLPAHEAAREHVDSLEEPDRSHEQQQYRDHVQRNSHVEILVGLRLRVRLKADTT